jgi:hypothetical protein
MAKITIPDELIKRYENAIGRHKAYTDSAKGATKTEFIANVLLEELNIMVKNQEGADAIEAAVTDARSKLDFTDLETIFAKVE